MTSVYASPTEEVERLRRCLNDLVGVTALPALWTGAEPRRVAGTLIEALGEMLPLAFVYVRLAGDPANEPVLELARVAAPISPTVTAQEIGASLDGRLGVDPSAWPATARLSMGGSALQLSVIRLGLHGAIGVLVAASDRPDFPVQTERLLLDVAANEATVGLQQARLLIEQKRVSDRLENALGVSERDSLLIVENIPGMVALLSPTGEVEVVNRQLLQYFAQPLDELKQWRMTEVVHPEDLPHVIDVFTRSIMSGTSYEIVQRFRRADGEYRWFQNSGCPVRDPDGRVVRWCVMLTDIDVQKRAADALRDSEAFLLEVQRLSHTGGWRYDVATDVIESSPEIERVYEPQPGDDIRKPAFWFDRIHPEDRPQVKGEFERCLRERTEYQAGYRIVLPDGTIRYQHATGHPIVDEHGALTGFLGASMDMTEHWRASRELEQASEVLRELQAELSRAAQVAMVAELAASIAHEVNQPLSGIVTNTSTCLHMLAADPPNIDGARETTKRALRDGGRAADVIERLRALFTKKDFALAPLDLNEATREVVALSSADLQRNGVTLALDLADDLPMVIGDRVQLQQVILNLLRNASDAMAGVHDRARELLIRTERAPDDVVQVTVRDTGLGVDPATVDRLFDAFHTTKTGGMGIGLSVSRSIVHRHRGRMWAQPNAGAGATFGFTLPSGD